MEEEIEIVIHNVCYTHPSTGKHENTYRRADAHKLDSFLFSRFPYDMCETLWNEIQPTVQEHTTKKMRYLAAHFILHNGERSRMRTDKKGIYTNYDAVNKKKDGIF